MYRNLNCDLCNRPLSASEVIRIPLREMQDAARAGFNPFTCIDDLIPLKGIGGISDEEHYRHWRQMVMNDTTDWGLCSSCALVFRAWRAKSIYQRPTSAGTIQESTPFQRPVLVPLNKWALASFILSLLSLCGGILTGIPAIVLGIIALRKIDESEGQTRGKGFAWAGIIVGLVISVILICLVLVALLSNTSAQ